MVAERLRGQFTPLFTQNHLVRSDTDRSEERVGGIQGRAAVQCFRWPKGPNSPKPTADILFIFKVTFNMSGNKT